MEARTSSEPQIRLTPSQKASGDRITLQSGPLSYTTPNPTLALGLVFPTPRLVPSMALPCVLSVRTGIEEEKEEETCQFLGSELQKKKEVSFNYSKTTYLALRYCAAPFPFLKLVHGPFIYLIRMD